MTLRHNVGKQSGVEGMRIKVLGSSAGGGFPQWNCHCAMCRGVRDGTIKAKPRTQSSIAIKLQSKWVLINASPDIHKQINDNHLSSYSGKMRDNPFAGIILVDSQIDHCAGLLMLREGEPLNVYATEPVFQHLTAYFPILNVLDHYCGYQKNTISLDQGASFTVDNESEVVFYPISLVSNAPPYSPHRDNPEHGETIGLVMVDKKTQKKCFYAPGVGVVDDALLAVMKEMDCILVDGTAWHDDDLMRAGVGNTYVHDMGHLPLSGASGLIAHLDKCTQARKILIHINNTNPVLNEASREREELRRHNIELAYDGMEIMV